jgi:hypothetical protein
MKLAASAARGQRQKLAISRPRSHHRGMRRTLIALALCAASSPASARSQKTLAYPRNESYAAALRFIRVDENLKVIEKDSDAGYVLFELREEKKLFRGSLEVIEVVEDGRHAVRFVMTLEDRPEWLELQYLQKLEHKLRLELGAPAPVPSPKRADEAPKPPRDPGKEPEPNKPKVDEKREKAGEHPDEGPPISPTP